MLEVAIVVGCALGFLVAVMLVGWVVQARSGNPAWSDVFWTLGVGAAGVACALAPLSTLPAPLERRLLIAGLCAAWSLRLGLHIARRVARGGEDARYVEMRDRLGSRFQGQMLGFMLIQAPVGAVLALAILLGAHAPGALGVLDLAAVAVLAAAIAGEATADAQLTAFKARPDSRGKVCDTGLWAISRHPNYLFEWLVWIAFPVAAAGFGLASPWPWLALCAPAMMYVLLTRVSGVPPLEQAMLASRGDAFRAYQARVPMFFPFLKPGVRS